MGQPISQEFNVWIQIDDKFKDIPNLKNGLYHILYDVNGNIVILSSGISDTYGRWYKFETHMYNPKDPSERIVDTTVYYQFGNIERFRTLERVTIQ